MTAARKKVWLQHITIAREIFDHEVETETTRMRDYMIRWQRNIRNHNNSPLENEELRCYQDWLQFIIRLYVNFCRFVPARHATL